MEPTEAMEDLDFYEMPHFIKINETVVVPSIENQINAIRQSNMFNLCRSKNDPEVSRMLQSRCFNEGIMNAIQSYGLRLSDVPHHYPEPLNLKMELPKKRKAEDENIDEEIVSSAIGSAIAEKGLR